MFISVHAMKHKDIFLSARWSQAKKATNEHLPWVAAQNSVHFFPPVSMFLCSIFDYGSCIIATCRRKACNWVHSMRAANPPWVPSRRAICERLWEHTVIARGPPFKQSQVKHLHCPRRHTQKKKKKGWDGKRTTFTHVCLKLTRSQIAEHKQTLHRSTHTHQAMKRATFNTAGPQRAQMGEKQTWSVCMSARCATFKVAQTNPQLNLCLPLQALVLSLSHFFFIMVAQLVQELEEI